MSATLAPLNQQFQEWVDLAVMTQAHAYALQILVESMGDGETLLAPDHLHSAIHALELHLQTQQSATRH